MGWSHFYLTNRSVEPPTQQRSCAHFLVVNVDFLRIPIGILMRFGCKFGCISISIPTTSLFSSSFLCLPNLSRVVRELDLCNLSCAIQLDSTANLVFVHLPEAWNAWNITLRQRIFTNSNTYQKIVKDIPIHTKVIRCIRLVLARYSARISCARSYVPLLVDSYLTRLTLQVQTQQTTATALSLE
jgi:hypothetical protein